MKKRTLTILSGIALTSGVMAFFGIPGLLQIYKGATQVSLDDISVCNESPCNDIMLSQSNLKPIVFANNLTLSGDINVKKDAVIVANSLNLSGYTLSGEDQLIILSREIKNGTVKVIQSTTDTDTQLNGLSGGLLYISAAKLHSDIILDISGTHGADGKDGRTGVSGRRGRCDGFGKWRAAKRGGKGEKGGDAGNGGNGGEIFLITSIDLPTLLRTDITGGHSGSPGNGGEGGAGGRGCVGLGGSQQNASRGSRGDDGDTGENGREGRISTTQLDLKSIKSFYQQPFSDLEPEQIRSIISNKITEANSVQ